MNCLRSLVVAALSTVSLSAMAAGPVTFVGSVWEGGGIGLRFDEHVPLGQKRTMQLPGRQVIEVRAPGMDKGQVVRRVAEESGAKGFCFAGDDLGDVEAFETVRELRSEGLDTLLVCSLSQEESALVERADVVVPGPEGVLELLRALMA